MSSQPLVKGTVRQSEAIPLADGSDVYPFETEHPAVSGLQTGTTNAVVNIPLEVSMGLMERGREKYTISCVPCHGGQGDGNGVVKYFGISAVKSLHDPDVVKQSDGDIYRTITLGKGVMKGYANTLSIEDRWAIVAYARALQLSRLGTEDEVPARFHVKETEEAETSAIAEEVRGNERRSNHTGAGFGGIHQLAQYPADSGGIRFGALYVWACAGQTTVCLLLPHGVYVFPESRLRIAVYGVDPSPL